MKPTATKIIRDYLTLTGVYTLAASIIWGVSTLFLLDVGLTILQVFFVNSIFTAAMALFEIPTGVLADTRGRRASFLLSIAILFLGTLGYMAAAWLPNNLWLLVLMSVVLGLGYTFYSGAMEAWLVDALQATNYEGELDQVFARSSMVSGAAMLVGSLAGGALGSLDLTVPFMLRVALLGVVFVIAYRSMHDLGFTPHQATLRELPHEMRKLAQASIQYGWQERSVRLLILAGLVQSLFMAWGFFAWQPYFLALLGQDAPWVAGVIAALISVSTMAGNTVVEWAAHRCGRRTTLLLIAAVIQTVAVIGVGVATSFWVAVPLYLLAMGMTGIWGPVKQAYMHQLIPSQQRATVISFDSLVASGGSFAGQNGLGQLAQVRSFGAGYVTGGLITILVWPTVWLLRQRADDVDFIVVDAGQESACAAQGLPAVGLVDTQAGTAVSVD
ncbi:MAG: MFS transporter [Chloroflexota bacterium]